VHNLKIDNAGNLWLTTHQPNYLSAIYPGSGLTKFDGDNWIVYDKQNSGLPSDYISYINTDNEGNVWIGTGIHLYNAGGLVKFDGNNWTIYNKDNSGLPSNIVSAIGFDSRGNV
jgi:ligand-binding sensor domain-containing protein